MKFVKAICNQPSLEMVERHGEQLKSIYCENVESQIDSMSALIKKLEEGGNVSLGIVTFLYRKSVPIPTKAKCY